MASEIISNKYKDLDELSVKKKSDYAIAKPFPHILLDDFFDNSYLEEILNNFPDLSKKKEAYEFKTKTDKKLISISQSFLSDKVVNFINFLNSHRFLIFLQKLTGIETYLIPDPYLSGGGLHETKNGGFLKVHADFRFHPLISLDRRINILIFLNKNWKEEWGGHLELWNRDMSKCVTKILPIFNRVVIFNTTDYTFHGHPDALNCPNSESRKSIALYYYTNGRPDTEINRDYLHHRTLFQKRKNLDDDFKREKVEFKKIFGKFYIRKKTFY
tara:strand:- start:1931 stop:2746 length:816 start_codon:yes stop_codon:yes gene_type:complete